MTSEEIRKRFLSFFKERGHAIIPSASLVPENDPTTLFTGSGMQPLLPYLLGEKHPQGTKLADSQKCFRTQDIEEVGDNRHTTFFEMLGNWSLGDYWKEEQIQWFFEFLTKEVKILPEKLWVTCFDGDETLGLSKDTKSAEIWKKLGIPESRIRFYGAKKNWWSRSGVPENMPAGEPGGPDSEVFYEFTQVAHDPKFGAECHPNCDCGRFLEIGNSVFMQYVKKEDGSFELLPKRNVDFGGGLERIAAASNNNNDIFLVNYNYIIKGIERVTKTKYEDNLQAYRIIADHIKAAAFLIGDGVLPSNTDKGYILRRLIRRGVRYSDILGIDKEFLSTLVDFVIEKYKDVYSNLSERAPIIKNEIKKEEEKFRDTLSKGLAVLNKELKAQIVKRGEAVEAQKISLIQGPGNVQISDYRPPNSMVTGRWLFDFYQTFGFPVEMIIEELKSQGYYFSPKEYKRLANEFKEEFEKHKEVSRAGLEKKFKGGLADTSEKTTMLHTTTHLMLAGLRNFLGEHVHQAGSNITPERTRFDFSHPEKVGRDILDKVEKYVNEAISKKCDVIIEQMPKAEAQKKGVEGSFWERYPDMVNVYMVKCEDGTIYSQELCGGPHVKNTKDIKGVFKIVKEEAVSAGVRRVKAVLE